MIIWRGFGFLVGIAGFAGMILANVYTHSLINDDAYYRAHAWPKLIGAAVGAAMAFAVVKILRRFEKPRIVIDKETGKEVELRRGDSLYFIPVRFWPFLIFGIGTWVAFAW